MHSCIFCNLPLVFSEKQQQTNKKQQILFCHIFIGKTTNEKIQTKNY